MTIHICDRCREQIDTYRFNIVFSGNNTVELCKKCSMEFKEWLKGEQEKQENKKDE